MQLLTACHRTTANTPTQQVAGSKKQAPYTLTAPHHLTRLIHAPILPSGKSVSPSHTRLLPPSPITRPPHLYNSLPLPLPTTASSFLQLSLPSSLDPSEASVLSV
ncbi:uncharacterized protein K452DRAFT_289369 [Aplosporella prunicola CBS 121167]|uniref:Uncharacterized protein n=1 Tax=Aplosporella prunicola CBS 121167 TaxID=1176127 RepID=A0A6A6B7U6_9PEZI|nr:uncharacterized protein K452DRAFT_289369 [Aplosporella prunicola CBS 121167]KAF2139986.1 hypothetical protein K452DRAFT_289369 [Aplosporella prunicola CBS 121167]